MQRDMARCADARADGRDVAAVAAVGTCTGGRDGDIAPGLDGRGRGRGGLGHVLKQALAGPDIGADGPAAPARTRHRIGDVRQVAWLDRLYERGNDLPVFEAAGCPVDCQKNTNTDDVSPGSK